MTDPNEDKVLAFLKAIKLGIAETWQTAEIIFRQIGLEEQDEQEEALDEAIADRKAYLNIVYGGCAKKHQEFMNVYFHFYQTMNKGIKPLIQQPDAKVMKSIMSYLMRESHTKDYEGALQSWEYILNNWEKLPEYYQRQTKLTNIYRNLNEILTGFRNGFTDPKTKKRAESQEREELTKRARTMLKRGQ